MSDKIPEEQMGVIPKPPENQTAATVGVLGFGAMVCEGIEDPENKGACRGLVVPLETKQKSAIDTLVELLLEHPDEMDRATERFNYNMQEAVKIAEERLKEKNAA